MFRTLNRSFIALLLSATAAAIPATAKPPPEFDLVRVAPGTFTMGTADLDAVRFEATEPDKLQIDDETPAREVSITRAFWLTRTEVTQAQWLAIMDTKPGPDSHWNRPDWERLPVVSVSWDDTQAFIRTLNALPGNWRYRLPTEAEWEFAARGGLDRKRYVWGDELGDYAGRQHSAAEIDEMAVEHGQFRVDEVEVCGECHWHFRRRSYVLGDGVPRAARRARKSDTV